MEKGIQTHTIKRMLGHKSIVTTAGYIHISQEFLSTVKSPLDMLYEDFKGSVQ
ncbi:MAG: integrase [Deltaproteobacteria bacterium]|nr:integrase [Deltaproteobacteria bacterium]